MNMTTQISAWSVLPSDHIFSLCNDATDCSPGLGAPWS